jgi:hypothetical protein
MAQKNQLDDKIEEEFDEIFEESSVKVKELIDKFQSNSRTFEQEPPWVRGDRAVLHVGDSKELIARLKQQIREKDDELDFLKSEIGKYQMKTNGCSIEGILGLAEEVHSDVSRDISNISSLRSKHVKARILKIKTVFNRCLILLHHPDVLIPEMLQLLTKLNVRTQRNS